MRLMRLARETHPVILGFVLTAALVAPTLAQDSEIPIVDLTLPTPREQQVSAVPGASVGGIGGQSLPRGYLLPLKIELMAIYPKPVKLGDKFTVEVLVRNTSASAFFLPTSQNGVAVLQHEGKGRRSFIFSLEFDEPKTGLHTSSISAVAMG